MESALKTIIVDDENLARRASRSKDTFDGGEVGHRQ
jgi:hypothetical protein